MVHQYSETKNVEIRPSDVYPNKQAVRDFLLGDDSYYIIAFRPPRYGEEYLNANARQVLGACLNATPANPRFILAKRIYLVDAWE